METLNFELSPNVSVAGLKISGGADSALVAYILSKYVAEQRPDVKIQPITVSHAGKSYQKEFSEKVIDFCRQQFGDIFLPHIHGWCDTGDQYVSAQDDIVIQLYKNKKIQCHFIGITQNPPAEAMDEIGWNGPADDRSAGIIRPMKENNAYRLLINTNKRGVYKLYKHYNILDTLFPLTRSCEAFTDNFNKHCGECWFCKERYWGFGRYE